LFRGLAMPRLVVLSNPRSGTSLLTHLLLRFFDLGFLGIVPYNNLDPQDMYSYRLEFSSINLQSITAEDKLFFIVLS